MRNDFLGGTGTVTGSKYLLTHEGRRLLVDCGLFQGLKQLRLRNWDVLPVDPAGIDAVLLTHAHMDHSGFVPRLVQLGFKGKVYCSAATRELCELLLPDSGRLQEEDADFANRHGHSKHKPALPLYTEQDARAASGASTLSRSARNAPRGRVGPGSSAGQGTSSVPAACEWAGKHRASSSRATWGAAMTC